MRKKALVSLILASVLCFEPVFCGAVPFKWFRKKTAKADTSAVAKKKTPYEKFLGKKGLVSAKGSMTAYKDGEDVFLEIPDSLVGKDISINSYIQSSTNLALSGGSDVSGRNTFCNIRKTDSLILFTTVAPVFATTDSTVARALSQSRSASVIFSFPIKYRNGSGYVIKANSLFDLSKDKTFSLYGAYFDDTQIYEATLDSDLSEIRKVMSFSGSVAVVQDATFKVHLLTNYEENLSATVVTTLTILGDTTMPRREADSRVGVNTTSIQAYDSRSGVKKLNIADRWDLRDGKKITVYIDTLLPPSWQHAIKEGLEAWNPAFRKIGLGDVISAKPYPSDSSFSAYNPKFSTVSFFYGTGQNLKEPVGRFFSDYRTGEILSTSIDIPRDYLKYIQFKCPYLIGDVDNRYFRYGIPDDAVCEVLRADIMKLFGKCLGLTSNYAGSLAYTPEELRSPSFTQEHGITGSVLDDVLFNSLTKPGDKERGVVTIVDRIGPYDEYAIEWLYRTFPEGVNEKQSLDSLIRSKAGMREYLYVPAQLNTPDPRANKNDLGSDLIASFDASMAHLHYAAANSDKWLSSPEVPEEEFRNLYVEWIWLQMLSNIAMLSPAVGGIMSEDVRAGDDVARFSAVPESLQRTAVKKIMDTLLDVGWLDSNKKLMHLSGAYSTYMSMNYLNAIQQSRLLTRLGFVCRACRIAGSTYTADKLMSDLQGIILKNVAKGKLDKHEDTMIGIYLSRMIYFSPVLTSNLKEAMRLKNLSLTEDYTTPLSSVDETDTEDLGWLAVKYLKKARTTLANGKAKASDSYTSGRIDYLIQVIDYSLGTK